MSNETNGSSESTTAVKGPAMYLLASLDKEFQEAKKAGKAANKKEQLELVAQFKKAKAAQEAAEKALEAAQEAIGKVCEEIVRRATGKSNVEIDDITWVPMSKGDKVYFRRLGSADVMKLGG